MRKGINGGIEASHKSPKSQCSTLSFVKINVLLNPQRKMSGTCSVSSHVEIETTNSSC